MNGKSKKVSLVIFSSASSIDCHTNTPPPHILNFLFAWIHRLITKLFTTFAVFTSTTLMLKQRVFVWQKLIFEIIFRCCFANFSLALSQVSGESAVSGSLHSTTQVSLHAVLNRMNELMFTQDPTWHRRSIQTLKLTVKGKKNCAKMCSLSWAPGACSCFIGMLLSATSSYTWAVVWRLAGRRRDERW